MSTTTRKIRFEAAYANGDEREHVLDLELEAGLEGEELWEELAQHTGFGPEYANVDAFYTWQSVDGLEPVIDGEWG